MSLLTRTLKVGCVGKDVEGAKRGVARYLGKGRLSKLTEQAPVVRRTFGPFFRVDVKRAQGRLELPASGLFGEATYDALKSAGAFDAKALHLLREYAEEQKPPLVEPKQGFQSLHKSLWEPYSIGRRLGLSDLGTYNPASTLPGGGPSDHSVYPAVAFDLGVDPDTGFAHPQGRQFFLEMMRHPAVEYVILGDRIWSHPRRAEGIRKYTAGGHMNHAHVSGFR